MQEHFYVNPFKCVIATIIFIILFLLAVIMFLIGRPISAIVFLTLGSVYVYVALMYGMKITIDETGISRSVLGITILKFSWEEIEEIGVCGTRVFNKNHKEKSGTLYIYTSCNEMSDEERFDMILKWPPRNKIYLLYSQHHLQIMQMMSGKKTELYNSGDLKI